MLHVKPTTQTTDTNHETLKPPEKRRTKPTAQLLDSNELTDLQPGESA